MMTLSIASLNRFLNKAVQLRCFSASQIVTENNPDKNKDLSKVVLETKLKETNSIKEYFVSLSKNWKEKYEIYYGKERDMVNYPTLTIPEYHPKVRMGVLPDEWFNALYNKTGVTGPYLLFWGGILFLIQKEVWIIDNHFYHAPAAAIAIFLGQRMLGPHLVKYYQKLYDKKEWIVTKRSQNIWKSMAQKSIDIAKEDKQMVDVNIDLFQATKENVGLQLEAVYRSRLVELHTAVKRRLDYQVDKELSKQRFQRTYMLNWIVDSVVKDFTPQQEKATIAQCITDLKTLGNRLKTVNV